MDKVSKQINQCRIKMIRIKQNYKCANRDTDQKTGCWIWSMKMWWILPACWRPAAGRSTPWLDCYDSGRQRSSQPKCCSLEHAENPVRATQQCTHTDVCLWFMRCNLDLTTLGTVVVETFHFQLWNINSLFFLFTVACFLNKTTSENRFTKLFFKLVTLSLIQRNTSCLMCCETLPSTGGGGNVQTNTVQLYPMFCWHWSVCLFAK